MTIQANPKPSAIKIQLSPRSFIGFIGRQSKGKRLSFFKFGRTKLAMLSTIEDIRRAGKLEKTGNPDRQAFNAPFSPILGQGAFTVPQDQWLSHKREILRHLTPAGGNKMRWQNIAEKVALNRLEQHDHHTHVNGYRLSKLITQDMMIEVFFGSSTVLNHFKLTLINRILMLSSEAAALIVLYCGDHLQWLVKIPQAVGKIAQYTLSTMIRNAKPVPGSPAADDNYKKELNTLLFAGIHPMTCALMTNLWVLGNDQDMQNQAREEIKTMGSDSVFLKNIVMESFRLIPPLHTPPLRVCTEDIDINGQTIPKGSSLVYSIWHAHRRCPHAEQFQVNRHLEQKEEIIPFGIGPKRCVGEHVAMTYLTTVLATMLINYKIIAKDDTYRLNPLTISYPSNPLYFQIEPLHSD